MQNQYVGMIPSSVCVCVCFIDNGVGWHWDCGALTGEAFRVWFGSLQKAAEEGLRSCLLIHELLC